MLEETKSSTVDDDDRCSVPLSLDFRHSFEQERSDAVDYVLSWGENGTQSEPALDRFESCFCIKNSKREVVHANSAFRKLVAGGATLTGASPDGYLATGFENLSRMTDQIMLRGAISVQLEHRRQIAGDRTYLFVTYKRRLDELKNPELCFMVFCRPLGVEADSPPQRQRTLSEQLLTLHEFDDTDRTICEMYYFGESTKTISAAVGLSTRSVENRRQKILDAFGFERPVEIVKLLTRLQEQALIRLDP